MRSKMSLADSDTYVFAFEWPY